MSLQLQGLASVQNLNLLSSYQLAHVNNGTINASCTNLAIGQVRCSDCSSRTQVDPGNQTLCLGLSNQDCKATYTVQTGDTCNDIVAAKQIDLNTLLENNPNLSEECNIFTGEVINHSL